MFALENFEKIKKRFGKELASEAAALIGEALEKEIRDMDLAARTDDDEFILLFSDTSMKKALSRLQNMAMRLNRLSINHHSEDIRLSLSLGLKSYQKGDEAAAVFHAASSDLQRNSRFSNTQKTKH